MAGLLGWLKSTSLKLVDPHRDARIQECAEIIDRQLYSKRDKFNLGQELSSLSVPDGEVTEVLSRAYTISLQKVWSDLTVTQKERAALNYVARALCLDSTQIREIETKIGVAAFGECLRQTIGSGQLDEKNKLQLDHVASQLGTTTNHLMRTYFAKEGEGFVTNIFSSFCQSGVPNPQEWNRINTTAESLGITKNELLVLIRAQAERYVEHILADAKSDEVLRETERNQLEWCLANFDLSHQFVSYVKGELKELQLLTDISRGRLPSLRATHLSLKAGEIAHFQSDARLMITKYLKKGPRVDDHRGEVTITDSRLIFSSDTKSTDISHRKVIEIILYGHAVEVRTGGRSGGEFVFGRNTKLGVAIYRAAVAKANQTLVEKREGPPSRHIPRDIRQRVWQKFGGRCAECEADDYLEFDHIIPVAKGGSNSETNVQLLCRRCNLKKSDSI